MIEAGSAPSRSVAMCARSSAVRALRVALMALCAAVFGCALHSPRQPGQQARTPPAPETAARTVVDEWQRRVGQHVVAQGTGDPAVLARLPALRSSAVQRPGQIVFGANDIESSQPERDGYDTFGLLLGRRNSTGGPWYVFVVGSLERRDYRPVSVADIRVVAMSVKDGATLWETGFGDTAALAKYRQGLDPGTALRFPADRDQFRLVDCTPGVCVEESVSGARWALYFSPAVAQTLDQSAAR
jgi:hypothetical protein